MKITTGADDVLGQLSPHLRAGAVAKLVSSAQPIKKIKRPTKKEEAARVKAKAQAADLARAAKEGRPMVNMDGDQLEVCNSLQESLDRAHPDTFYWRGGELIMRQGGTLVPVTRNRVTALILRAARTGRAIANPLTEQTGWRDEHPSFSTISAVLGDEVYWPKLDSITETPFVRPDGTLCLTTGYDEPSKVFLLNSLDVQVPEDPDTEDVRSAVKLLADEWLGDMLFGGDADRSMALALMLTPFMRPMFPTTPLFAIDGNRPGTGKGLLMEVFGQLVLGHHTPLNSLPTEEDEVRKSITSLLLSGSNILAWDEVRHIRGRAMAQLLTAPIWSDRVLGASRTARITNRATFIVAGNQIRLGGDLFRRVVRIRLETAMERPQDRPTSMFRHANLGAWTEDNRGRLVSAVFTLVRAWDRSGRPGTGGGFGSFEGWYQSVGGVLMNADLPFSLEGTRDWATEADEESNLWDDHLLWLERQFGHNPFTVRQVTDKLEADQDSPVLPLAVLTRDVTDRRYRVALGNHYRQQSGVWSGDLMIRGRGRDRTNTAQYMIERRRSSSEDEGIVLSRTHARDTPTEDPEKYLQSSLAPASTGIVPAYSSCIPEEGETHARAHAYATPPCSGEDAGTAGTEPAGTSRVFSLDGGIDTGNTPQEEKNTGGTGGSLRPSSSSTDAEQGGVTRTRTRERRTPDEDAGTTRRDVQGSPAGIEPSPYVPRLYDSIDEPDPGRGPADVLLESLSAPMSSECPECGTPEQLVDALWFACPKCDPATAGRGSEEWMQ